MSALRREHAEARALLDRHLHDDLAFWVDRYGSPDLEGPLRRRHREDLHALNRRSNKKGDEILAAAAAARAVEQASAQVVGGPEVAEEAMLDQDVGVGTPDDVDKDAEEGALGHVVGGGVPDEEVKVDGVVSSPVVEESVAASSTAPTIPDEEDKPSGDLTATGNTGPGGAAPDPSTGRHGVTQLGFDRSFEVPGGGQQPLRGSGIGSRPSDRGFWGNQHPSRGGGFGKRGGQATHCPPSTRKCSSQRAPTRDGGSVSCLASRSGRPRCRRTQAA